jgi:hypothetical protein
MMMRGSLRTNGTLTSNGALEACDTLTHHGSLETIGKQAFQIRISNSRRHACSVALPASGAVPAMNFRTMRHARQTRVGAGRAPEFLGLGRVLINAQLRRSFEAIDVNASAAAYGRSPKFFMQALYT